MVVIIAVRKRGAQKLSRHQQIYSVDPLRPTASRRVRKLMAVPGNEIFRSVCQEKLCGFRFLAGGTRIGTRRYVAEDRPLISSLPSNGRPALKPDRLLLF